MLTLESKAHCLCLMSISTQWAGHKGACLQNDQNLWWKVSWPWHPLHQAFYLKSFFQVVEQDFWLCVMSDRDDFRDAPCEIHCCFYAETPRKGEVRAIHLCIGLKYHNSCNLNEPQEQPSLEAGSKTHWGLLLWGRWVDRALWEAGRRHRPRPTHQSGRTGTWRLRSSRYQSPAQKAPPGWSRCHRQPGWQGRPETSSFQSLPDWRRICPSLRRPWQGPTPCWHRSRLVSATQSHPWLLLGQSSRWQLPGHQEHWRPQKKQDPEEGWLDERK